MVMFPFHQIWPKLFWKAQWKGEEDKADRGRGGKTSGNGQAWCLASPRGHLRTGKNGENWLQNHLWCPNDPRGEGIDDDDDLSMMITSIEVYTFISAGLMTLVEIIDNSSFRQRAWEKWNLKLNFWLVWKVRWVHVMVSVYLSVCHLCQKYACWLFSRRLCMYGYFRLCMLMISI